MVVRADNRAYGTKACQFLGDKLGGKGKVVMLQGDLASINGRDRTEAFNDCMKAELTPASRCSARPPTGTATIAAHEAPDPARRRPGHQGRLHAVELRPVRHPAGAQAASGLLVPPTDPKHVFVVSNDGIPEELKDIARRQHRRHRLPAGRPVRQVRPATTPRPRSTARRSSPARPITTAPSSRCARACWRTSSPRRWSRRRRHLRGRHERQVGRILALGQPDHGG